MSRKNIDSVDDLADFVNRSGMCYLFKSGEDSRICDFIGGRNSTAIRARVLELCEEAHLDGRILLTVDENGGLMAMSLKTIEEKLSRRRAIKLTRDEKALLAVIDEPMSTPELRLASNIPKTRFDRSLAGLRFKMMIALVEIRKESRTKHLNCFDRFEKWRRTAKEE